MRWGPGESWDVDRGGVYTDGAWTFDLDEEKFPDGIDFKFVLAPGRWLQGGNQHLDAGQCVDTVDYELDDGPDLFEARQAAIIERGAVAQRLFVRNLPTSRSPATRPGRPFRAAGVQPGRALALLGRADPETGPLGARLLARRRPRPPPAGPGACRGLTDHAIRFCHCALPPASSPHNVKGESAKVILRHPAATAAEHAFAIVVELGSDFNQGRYVNAGLLELESKVQQGWLLCEVVFMSYAALEEANTVTLTEGADGPVALAMNPSRPRGPTWPRATRLPPPCSPRSGRSGWWTSRVCSCGQPPWGRRARGGHHADGR